MKKIFVDLEMHPINAKLRKQMGLPQSETIEIGAVVLEDDGTISDRFRQYIHPDYVGQMRKYYVDLTGITDEMLVGAHHFPEAFADFLAWCGSDYEIYSWSMSDLEQIVQEMEVKVPATAESDYMQAHWIDFQEEYDRYFHDDHVYSLQDAIANVGLNFKGRPHDGLTDAENTAFLYTEMHDEESLKKMMSYRDGSAEACTAPLFAGIDLKNLLGGSE